MSRSIKRKAVIANGTGLLADAVSVTLEYDVVYQMAQLNDKWHDLTYNPTVDDFMRYMHLKYDDDATPKYGSEFYRAKNVPGRSDENVICRANDLAHAAMLFEQAEMYDFVSVFLENHESPSSELYNFRHLIQDLATYWREDDESVSIAKCVVIEPDKTSRKRKLAQDSVRI